MFLFTIISSIWLLLENRFPYAVYNKYSSSSILLHAAGGGVWVAVHSQLAGGSLRLQGSTTHCGGLHGLGDQVLTHRHEVACH